MLLIDCACEVVIGGARAASADFMLTTLPGSPRPISDAFICAVELDGCKEVASTGHVYVLSV